MIKNIFFYTFLICIFLLLSSCASRFNYTPNSKYLSGDYVKKIRDTDSYITRLNKDGATLDNNNFITTTTATSSNASRFANLKYKLPDGFYFLNYINNTLLASSDKGELLVYKHTDKSAKIFNLKNRIVASSIKDDSVALIFSDNSIGVYDINNRHFLLKEYLPYSRLNTNKISNPLFYKNAIFFPSLDGKIVVTTKYKIIEKINISQGGITKNIIFFYHNQNSLIVATSHKLLSIKLAQDKVDNFDADIRDIKVDGESIYIATLQGDIIKLDDDLKVIHTKKFKFAKFYTLGVGAKYIWALEKDDYIVRIDKNFNSHKVFELNFDDKKKTISLKDRLYFDDKMMILQ